MCRFGWADYTYTGLLRYGKECDFLFITNPKQNAESPSSGDCGSSMITSQRYKAGRIKTVLLKHIFTKFHYYDAIIETLNYGYRARKKQKGLDRLYSALS
jgi:hypothetical protein